MPAWEACPCALKIFRMPPPVIDKCNNASVKGLMIMCQHVSSPNHANVVLVAWLRGMLTLIPGKSAT